VLGLGLVCDAVRQPRHRLASADEGSLGVPRIVEFYAGGKRTLSCRRYDRVRDVFVDVPLLPKWERPMTTWFTADTHFASLSDLNSPILAR
jgi:hypothetical protein